MTMDAMIFSDWIDEIIEKKIEAKELPKGFDVDLQHRKDFVEVMCDRDRRLRMSDGEITKRITQFIGLQAKRQDVLDSIAYHQQRDEL